MSARSSRYHVTVTTRFPSEDYAETSHMGDRRKALAYAKGATTRGFAAVEVVDTWAYNASARVLFTWSRPEVVDAEDAAFAVEEAARDAAFDADLIASGFSDCRAECPRRFLVTFDTVTFESAERGDVETRGYVHSNGMRDPLESINSRIDLHPSYVYGYGWRLHKIVREFGTGMEDHGGWFYPNFTEQNARTGAETRFYIHPPKDVTPSSYARLCRVFNAR